MYVFTTRADTIMGVTFCAVAPEHPLALACGQRQPGTGRLHRRVPAGGTTEAELATREKEGVPTGPDGDASADRRRRCRCGSATTC